MSRPAGLDGATPRDALDNLSVELVFAEHLCDLIDRIVADEMERSNSEDEFMRHKNQVSALARSVARSLRDAGAGIQAVWEILPAVPSTLPKGASDDA